MSPFATVKSVRRAGRVIKRLMNYHPEGWGDTKERSREALRRTIEETMAEQVKSHLEDTQSRGEQDRRNGTFRRHLLTGLGDIELAIPRTRRYSPISVAQAYARRTEDVDRSILACFVLGLSTRKVSEALLPIFGVTISASTVSRVAQVLDEAVVAFHRRPLRNQYRVLQFDGVILSRKTGKGALRRPVLVVLGIRPDGKKEIIDFLLARSEGRDAWEGFLNDLYQRGLTGEGVELITIDGCAGLASALEVVYPRILIQRCWAHKVRNILDHARVADREEMKRGLRRIYRAQTRLHALREAIRFASYWEERYPRAVRCLMKDIEELLNHYCFADPTWRRAVRTTNAIERRFREVRRRTRPMGVFSDRMSIERILYAIFSYANKGEGAATPFLLMTQKK
jgi:transposase-like protein